MSIFRQPQKSTQLPVAIFLFRELEQLVGLIMRRAGRRDVSPLGHIVTNYMAVLAVLKWRWAFSRYSSQECRFFGLRIQICREKGLDK